MDLLIGVLIIFAVAALCYWLVTLLPDPPFPPLFRTVAIVVLVVVCLVMLFRLLGGGRLL